MRGEPEVGSIGVMRAQMGKNWWHLPHQSVDSAYAAADDGVI